MLDVAASARQLSSRSALGWGAGALSLGALLALLAMLAVRETANRALADD